MLIVTPYKQIEECLRPLYPNILSVPNTRIDSALTLAYHLAKNTNIRRIVNITFAQCPDRDIPLGKIIQAIRTSEWDTPSIPLDLPVLEIPNILYGVSMSGGRACINRTTQIMQAKMVDIATYPLAKASSFLHLPFYSIGSVIGHCEPKDTPISILDSITERIQSFIQSNLQALQV